MRRRTARRRRQNGNLGIRGRHGLQHAVDRLGVDVIVGVHKEDDLALGRIDTGISSARDASVFLVNHQHTAVGMGNLAQDA